MSLIGKGIGAALLPFKNPMIAGATVGAGIGYSGQMDTTNALEAGAKGALFGGLAGAGIGGLIRSAPSVARGTPAFAKGTLKGTAVGVQKGLGFVERNPGLALGATAAGGAGLLANSVIPDEMAADSPTLQGLEVNTSYNQQAIAADQMMIGSVAPTGMVGTANQMMGPMQKQFQASTTGLVQGLHRSRH